MLREKILEEGEMNSQEIHDWMNARIRMGVTMNWVGNVMTKSGLFEQTGTECVRTITGCRYNIAVWDVKR